MFQETVARVQRTLAGTTGRLRTPIPWLFAGFVRARRNLRRLDIIAGRNHIDHGSEHAKMAGGTPDGRED